MRIIVTGAARGIGRAIALKLARDVQRSGGRARLALVDLAADASLAETEARLATVPADAEAPARVTRAAVEWLGGLDGLVCNAGIVHPRPLLDVDAGQWDRVMNVNARQVLLMAQAAQPALARSRGAIVAIASMSGVEPHALNGSYSAAKAAEIMLVRQLAQEWGPDGIRANVVSPGMTRTSLSEELYRDPATKAARERMVPLRRIADPHADIAGCVAFLLSPEARYVTGVNLVADGGVGGGILGHLPGRGVSKR
jgi:NAD(P)-dependent dehydrogenase (short-subunit alcohol dehydrogenase family)